MKTLLILILLLWNTQAYAYFTRSVCLEGYRFIIVETTTGVSVVQLFILKSVSMTGPPISIPVKCTNISK